ncbi:MAG: hemolysin family protein [Tissierellia bacterium]|nr:hemolysin family protein [Tissierellia bacterium]
MDSDAISQVLVFCLFIIVSAFFTASQTAFTNFNKVRIKNLVNSGNKKVGLTLRLIEDYDKLLSTIIIGLNISNITAVSLSTVFFYNYYKKIGVVFSIVIMIAVILILGVFLPTIIVKKRSVKFAIFSAPILKVCIFIFSPINYIIANFNKIINSNMEFDEETSLIEDELITMINEVENEGVMNKNESDLIRSAIEFNEVSVEDIFTPRTDIVAIEDEDSIEYVKDSFLTSGYSRLPVYQDNIDNIIGVLHEKDFYQAVNRKEKDFKKLISDVLYVTPNKKISDLLKDLQLSKLHMAIVIDEYGGTAGLVTMEDIIEELVGEIWDEHDEVVEWFKKIGEDKYLISCNADIDDMFDLFDIEPDEELDISTVNGWLTMIFEEIPEVGGKIQYKNLDITVTKAEAKRVLEISVEKIRNQVTSNN